jgi:lipopolysaccharide/colanic/teichoic acid biosynthesis glycosyltransferase
MLAKESRFEAGSATLTPAVSAHHDGGVAIAVPAVPEHAFGRSSSAARLDAAAKRALDIAVSAVMLVALAPLIVLVAVLVRLESHGPALFLSPRVGHRGRELRMLKFRKMHHDASGLLLTTDRDDRFTRIGAFLAKSKLDELPQLWHVLTGEMSLVGPRPETRDFVSHHADAYDEILSVRPGLLGFSQIAFVAEGRVLDEDDPLSHYLARILPQKVKLDVMYARQRTLLLDLRILGWSLVAVLLRRQVAVNRQSGAMNLRRR